MSPNFTACGSYYLNNTALFPQYAYHGAVKGLPGQTIARPPLITVDGCKSLCGSSSEYYPWKAISQTITTWVLPGIGLLLQLPYESNAFWRTVGAMTRWTGNPIATFSYTLWNIKVTSKSALMVDMATKYNELPGPDSPFAQVRDSLYILTVMNQCGSDWHHMIWEANRHQTRSRRLCPPEKRNDCCESPSSATYFPSTSREPVHYLVGVKNWHSLAAKDERKGLFLCTYPYFGSSHR